nr:MAG: nucleocapsid protein [Shanxi tick virus 2]
MPLPVSMLTFTSKQGWDQWWRQFKEDNTRLTITNRFTVSESLCKEILPPDTNFPRATGPELDAAVSGRVHVRLADCAPIKECAWVASNLIADRSFKWFEQNKTSPLLEWHTKYDMLKGRLPSSEEVRQYQEAALAWREAIGFEVNNLTMAAREQVVKVYSVSPNIVTDIKDLLDDMKQRRNKALGIEDGKERQTSAHVDQLYQWITDGDWTVPCPWGDWGKKNKEGHLLAATAGAGIIGKRLMTKAQLNRSLATMVNSITTQVDNEAFSRDLLEALSANISGIPAAVDAFLAARDQQPGGAFVQQGSAIDTAFSSYYWAWASGVRLETFPSLSSMLFALGKAPQGKKKIEKKLKDCPFVWAQRLLEMFSTLKDDPIHMHPGVLTAGRMASEMVCSFGAFPVSDPSRVSEGASSPRFILNFKSEGDNPGGMTISAIFREYKAAYPDWKQQAIVPVEHMFHQTLLSKQGPFVNVNQVKGNALNVEIRGVEDY